MKTKLLSLISISILVLASCVAKHDKIDANDYQRAEKALTDNIKTLVFDMGVYPNWINNSSDFWFISNIRGKKQFFMIKDEKKDLAFNHEELASKLSSYINKEIDAYSLPFNTIQFDSICESISFQIDTCKYTYNLKANTISEEKLTKESEGNVSPNGKLRAIVKNHNLYIENIETGKLKQLTKDGEKWNDYAQALPSPRDMVREGKQDIEQLVDVFWTPDSKKIVTYRMDQRNSGKQWLVQSVPNDTRHPKLYEFTYSLPEDKEMAKAYPVIFDVDNGRRVDMKVRPIELVYIGSPWWLTNIYSNNKFYFLRVERGYREVNLIEVDLATGNTRKIFTETNKTCVDPSTWALYFTKDCSELIWASERDGWTNLYLYDVKTASLKNKITTGEWVVRSINKVDEDARKIYMMGAGRDKTCNPYYTQLFSVNFDGSDFKCLTPENTYQYAYISPDFKSFVNVQSTLSQEPVSSLRDLKDGKELLALGKADIADLKATNWIAPEEFIARAEDGSDIYCTIYKPSNFDESVKYPIIDKVYTGPHSFFGGKNFWAFSSEAQSFAELGFIVVEIDGRGTNHRGKKFHDYSYQNLGGGCDDHVPAIKQMANKFSYMDAERVGIYGFSAGGYDTAHAMFKFPDFYKVGISASGNHDHRMDKTWWNELWMGYPVNKHYEEQSNINWAHKLKGKLLLVHGELDNNVNPAATMQLVDALMKANKDFDMLIIPNQFHFLYESPYYVRKRWDYFVKNLRGIEPPHEYKIGNLNL